MSYNENSYPEYPGHVPAKKRSKAKTPIIAGVTGLIALFAGVGIGLGDDGTATATPAETVTATATTTATAEPEVRTENVEVEVTPAACLEALDHAETAMETTAEVGLLATEYIAFIPRAFEAGMSYDSAEAEVIMSEMDSLTAEITGYDLGALRDGYDVAAEQCRGAGA
jgi:hypothetical protein